MRPKNFASLTTFIGVFPRRMLGSGKKNVLLMKVDADCLGGGKHKDILRHPLLDAVNTQLHSPLHSVQRISAHSQSKVVHKQGRTLQHSFNNIVNPDADGGRRQL